eukprot:scaffold14152_cov23-Cyclotella_meneghiniana.AAC.2
MKHYKSSLAAAGFVENRKYHDNTTPRTAIKRRFKWTYRFVEIATVNPDGFTHRLRGWIHCESTPYLPPPA